MAYGDITLQGLFRPLDIALRLDRSAHRRLLRSKPYADAIDVTRLTLNPK